MVQAFAPDAPEEPLAGGVLAGRAIGRPQLGDAARLDDPRECGTVLAVVVADEEPGLLPERRRLAELLRDPGVGRVPRHADVDRPA